MFRVGLTTTFKAISGARKFATYKTSTGLVGLAVDVDGAATLLNISQKALTNVKVRLNYSLHMKRFTFLACSPPLIKYSYSQQFHIFIQPTFQKIPESSEYRVNVEKWFKFISNTIAEKNDIKAIEDEIALGQIEEVIEMAKDELTLIDYYHENKVWELVEEEKQQADAIVGDMEESIYFTSPESRVSAVPPP